MLDVADDFKALTEGQKRRVHLRLCENALAKWRELMAEGPIEYTEGVCGTRQSVDADLPRDALLSVSEGRDVASVEARYREPITAMQDGDLVLPDAVSFAYYAVYNAFRKHVLGTPIDDWLIVNQAWSAETDKARWRPLLEAAIRDARRVGVA